METLGLGQEGYLNSEFEAKLSNMKERRNKRKKEKEKEGNEGRKEGNF